MEGGMHQNLPAGEAPAFRADLEREARLAGVQLDIDVDNNGDGTVNIAWRIRQAGAAAVGGMLAGAAAGAAGGAAVGGPVLAGVGAVVGAVAGAVASGTGGDGGIGLVLRDAAGRVGVDAALLTAIAMLESSLKPTRTNPNSSAFGLFQFFDGTWRDMVQRHGAALGVSVEDRAGLAAQALMGAAYLKDNAASLRTVLGREPKAAECYAAHFFGAGTAASLLVGGQDIPGDKALGARAAAVIGANPSIFRDGQRIRTVGEVMALFEAKMDHALPKARALMATLAAPPAGIPAAGTATVAAPAIAPAAPPWLAIARGEIGQKEAQGSADNPRIVAYFASTTGGANPDSVPWCGAFVSFCLQTSGIIRRGSARAADWLEFGQALAEPRLGCITVLKPQSAGASGHVAFWIKTEGGMLQLLGGNQRDAVNITAFPVGALREGGFRWPSGMS